MLTDTSFPGPAYILSCGLSTWPERQFEWKKQDYRNSLNHPMQGGFTAFMHESVGGIQPTFERPGFKQFLLKPHLTSELEWANTRMESPYGTIRSDWKSIAEEFTWTVEIPPNSSATLYFPFQDGKQLREAESTIEQDTRRIEEGDQVWIEHEVGSGRYQFSVDKE
jgi:alpha-L-rhamnosidase